MSIVTLERDKEGPEMTAFQESLTRMLNYHGIDAACDTPDFILAEYLITGVLGYQFAIARRKRWMTDPAPTTRP